jgi:hypothetical protein
MNENEITWKKYTVKSTDRGRAILGKMRVVMGIRAVQAIIACSKRNCSQKYQKSVRQSKKTVKFFKPFIFRIFKIIYEET